MLTLSTLKLCNRVNIRFSEVSKAYKSKCNQQVFRNFSSSFAFNRISRKLGLSQPEKTVHQITPSRLLHGLPKPEKEPGKGKGPISWKSLFISLGIGGVLVGVLQYAKREKQLSMEKQRRRELGKADIGGRFNLVDHTGQPRSSKDFFGQWLLIYFGFTHCPDICPEEIEKMIEVVEDVNKSEGLPKVQPIFISVDPDRDTVEAVAKYINEFSPKLIGLTGNKEQVKEVTKAYRVYYSEGPKDEDNDYIVDHTVITYLIDPEGEFVDYYGQTKSAQQIANGIVMHMLKFKNAKGSFV